MLWCFRNGVHEGLGNEMGLRLPAAVNSLVSQKPSQLGGRVWWSGMDEEAGGVDGEWSCRTAPALRGRGEAMINWFEGISIEAIGRGREGAADEEEEERRRRVRRRRERWRWRWRWRWSGVDRMRTQLHAGGLEG